MQITDVHCDVGSGLLRLCTDAEHEGWAVGIEASTASIIETHYRSLLVGETPWERERIWQALVQEGRRAGLQPLTWGVVDIALWDLLGKAQGLPVFRAIGGFRDRVPTYVCGADGVDGEEAVRQALEARDEGFWGYKVKLEGRSAAERLRTLRREVGDSLRIFGDGEQDLELEAALALGRVLEEIDAHWFEEPLLDGDVTGLQKLADALDIPVVAGGFAENSILAGTRALTTRAVDRVKATIPTMGGISDALKLARGAEALGMNCEIDWDRRFDPHAAVQLLGAVRNAEFFAVDPAAEESTIVEPLTVVDGEVHLPQEPGLGLRFTDPSLVS